MSTTSEDESQSVQSSPGASYPEDSAEAKVFKPTTDESNWREVCEAKAAEDVASEVNGLPHANGMPPALSGSYQGRANGEAAGSRRGDRIGSDISEAPCADAEGHRTSSPPSSRGW